MRKIICLLSTILFFTVILSSNLHASVIKGKNFYAQTLKQPCGFSGEIMGKKYTVNEWKTFYESNKLGDIIKTICPKTPELISEKDLTNLYHFLSSFASDSGNIPSCN